MPDHDRTTDAASAWLTRLRGEPSAADQSEFDAWYCADAAHARAFDNVLAAFESSSIRAAAGDAERTRAALMHHRPPPLRRYAMAAAIAVVLLVTGVIVHGGWLFAPRAEMAVMLSTGVGEIRTETLADGSSVILDTTSRAKVLIGDKERRVILLQGRARFAPVPDAARRFVVTAANEEIEARHTLFDVALTDHGVAVTLLKGSAAILPVGRSADAQSARLIVSGQSLVSGPDGRLSAAAPASSGDLRWVSGLLSFEDAPLDEVVRAANRYSDRQIRLDGIATRSLRFTGTIRPTETANLAAMLAAMLHLRLRHDQRGDYLLDQGSSAQK